MTYQDYRDPKEELDAIEESRSPQSRAADEARTHSKVVSPDSPETEKWADNPASMDVEGVDTQKFGEDEEELEEGGGEEEGMEGEEAGQPAPRPNILSRLMSQPAPPLLPNFVVAPPTVSPVLSGVEPTGSESEQSQEDFVKLSKDDNEYLFGTEHPLLDANNNPSNIIDMSKEDNEFIFGLPKEYKKPPARPRVTYQVGKKPPTKRKSDKEIDEFLFGTKGVL